MSEMKVEGSKIPAEDITNPELKEAIEAMQAEGSKQNIDNMINKVIEAKFILPARVTQIPSASTTNGRTVMNNQTQVQFRLLENTKKEKFFGVFTDIEELYRWKGNEEAQKVVTDFDSIAHMVMDPKSNVLGFVINPFHENLPFTQEMLTSIGQTLLKVKKEREAAANSAQGEQPGAGITHTVNSDPE